MVKIFTLIGFLSIYLSASAQKAFYFKDASADLNKYTYFYMGNSTMDAHELTNPYLDKKLIDNNNIKYFILYNELSLKNLTLIDGHSDIGTICINLYEGAAFDEAVLVPATYKKKKLKGNFLILDAIDGNTKSLLWRGWMDLKKIKAATPYIRYQKAICALLFNFNINPTIIE